MRNDDMRTIILKGLPDHMIRRLLPERVTGTEIVYANIGTVMFLDAGEDGTLVVFDVKSEWNYVTAAGVEELFGCMSGIDMPAVTERVLDR